MLVAISMPNASAHAFIEHVQGAKSPAPVEAVAHEVQRPDFIGPPRGVQRLASRLSVASSPDAAFEPIAQYTRHDPLVVPRLDPAPQPVMALP